MSRRLPIFHRRPRTRRERMRIRFHRAYQGLTDRWTQLHARRHARVTQQRMQEVWQHLAHDAHAERAAHRRRVRISQLRHHHR